MAERDASRPAAGAARDTFRNALGVILGGGLAYVLPEGTSPEMRAAALVLVLAIVSPALAAAGKWARSQGVAVPFVFLLAVLLAGCAFESSKFNLAAADSEASTMRGEKITVTNPETGVTTVCEGDDCRWRQAISRGFSVPFTGVLGRLVEGAAALVGMAPPAAPQPIEVSIEGVTVAPAPESPR